MTETFNNSVYVADGDPRIGDKMYLIPAGRFAAYDHPDEYVPFGTITEVYATPIDGVMQTRYTVELDIGDTLSDIRRDEFVHISEVEPKWYSYLTVVLAIVFVCALVVLLTQALTGNL